MSTENRTAFTLVPDACDLYVARSIPPPADHESRREEARTLLIQFFARRILTQMRGIEDSREAA